MIVPRRHLVLTLVLSAAAVAWTEPRVTRVLFIGNSYTYFNNLPEIVARLAEAGGAGRVETRMAAPGGWKLKDHWERGSRAVLEGGKWDFVVLQEQSALGTAVYVDGLPRVDGDWVFTTFVEKWVEAALAAGAKPVLYLTWAREASPGDQAVLNHYYLAAAAVHDTMVAPAGIAWDRVRKTSSIGLFAADGSHPSPAGSYLSACVLYATIFGRSPAGLPPRITGVPVNLDTEQPDPGRAAVLVDLTATEARTLQTAAWEARRLDRRVPPKPALETARHELDARPGLTTADLVGKWSGRLLFYPSGPADVVLTLRPAGPGWAATVDLRFHAADVLDETVEVTAEVTGRARVSFTCPRSAALENQPVRFVGVLVDDGELRGVAEATVDRPGLSPARLSGSWTARRER
jgi:hypothetical protein